MVEMVKAVLPGRAQAWLVDGAEYVTGFVVRAADIEWATTPAQLVEALGLRFPGSPIPEDAPFVDLLVFEPNGLLTFVDAIGGSTPAAAARAGGPFVEPAPFTGTGFVATEQAVPLWWLEPARIPAGAQLWRVTGDGRRSLLAVYPHVGIGWQPAPGVEIEGRRSSPASDVLGIFTTLEDMRLLADVLPDGTVIVASAEQLPGMRERSERGLWWAATKVVEPVSFRLRATWKGLPFHVVQRERREGVESALLVYAGHDHTVAEAAGLAKTDQGVYEAVAPWGELADLEGSEISRAGR